MKYVKLCACFSLVLICLTSAFAEETLRVSDVHRQLAERHLEAGHPFWAVRSYRLALESGSDDPNLHRNLSQVLYDLGFVDQAIDELQLAIDKAPEEDFLHMEMGVFYLAAGRLPLAHKEFTRVLELNPGFSYGYYYLGEVLFRLGEYNLSSMALVIAEKLGLPGFGLERKLADLGWVLPDQPWHCEPHIYHLRRITLPTLTQARQVMQRLEDGELFEELAREFSTGREAQSGGYVGGISLASMPENFSRELAGRPCYSAAVLLESSDGYHIVQRIAPFDADLWQKKAEKQKSQRRAQMDRHATQDQQQPKRYVLLSGVFRNHDYADQRVARLLKLGMKSYLQARGTGEHLRYEVIVGQFDEYAEAETAGKTIKKSGLEYYIRKNNDE
nr:tetratricopeptide repeat protein [uncultured Desulfuromonas sp.]